MGTGRTFKLHTEKPLVPREPSWDERTVLSTGTHDALSSSISVHWATAAGVNKVCAGALCRFVLYVFSN